MNKEELKRLIRTYEEWLKDAKEKLRINRDRHFDYKELDRHSLYLAISYGDSKGEVEALEIVVSNLKKLMEGE